MNYADLITELSAFYVGSEGDNTSELESIRKAKAYDDEGLIIPGRLRARLRKLREDQVATTCERLGQSGVCVWLSEREPPGVVARCPFYPRGQDPRECGGYRAITIQQRRGLDIIDHNRRTT